MREKIGDYIIDQSFEPRTGSFGSTYRGKHPLFKGKHFAIKVIDNIDGRKKFDFISEIEALLALQFQCEHIVVFSYAGETPEGDLYCAMEYCEGGDLNELCLEKKGLPAEHVALIGRQACLGLAEAHGQGIIHRDIKPSNMMLGRLRNGELGVKLIDFGLAKTLDDTMQSAPGVKGTPLFASPEQIRDEDLDSRSDIYSLGVAMWYLLQGKKPEPLDLDNRHEVEAEHVNYDRPFKVTECDKDLAVILEKMMAKKRGERYSSASEVLSALDHYLKKKAGFPEKALSCSDLVDDDEGSSKARRSPPVLDENRSIAERRSDKFDDVFDHLSGSPLDCSWSKFMLARRKQDKVSSLIAILNTRLFADGDQKTFDEVKQLVDSHVALQGSGRGYPDAFLRPLAFYWFSSGEAVIEFEPREGILLRDVVRRHGRFQFSHALPLLSTLADLLDYTAEMGVPVPTVGEAEILLVPSDRDSNNQFLSESIPNWPRHRVEVNPLSLPASISFSSEEFDVEQTLDSNDSIISSVGENFPASVVFCARLYRLIGGKPVPSVAYQSRYGYSSISGLTEESNNLLCDHICGAAGNETKCSDILRSICDAEGENFNFSEIDFSVSGKSAASPGTGVGTGGHSSSTSGRSSDRRPGSGGIQSSRRGRSSGPPSLPKSDIEASISVSAGPQYQSYNLPEAVSTGPGEFRNPITKKRFSLQGPEIRPYKQFICQETGDMFQLSAQIEALVCLADVKEPGIIHSPYIPVDQDTRINFLETEGVELWQEGERGTCPVSGLQYKLPASLPRLKAIIYENEPGKVSSPFFPSEEDCQAIEPELWVGGTILSTRNREYVLPDKLPAPKLIKSLDEYRGVVTSPFVDAEFKVPDSDWEKGKVLVCQITDLLCRLPDDLPDRKHVARIHGDGSDGIVINPFTKREQKIPGEEWRSNRKIKTDDGKEFLLPSVIPELKVSKYLLEKPGWIVDPYSGAKTDLLPDEWELGLSVERDGRSFLLLEKLPELKEATVREGVFDKVLSPYSGAEIPVTASQWRRGEILKCPESKCLCKLPEALPGQPELVSNIPQQNGFTGTIESPYAAGKMIEVPGGEWVPGALIQCGDSSEFVRLPDELPPLVGETLEEGGKLKAFSPYADHEEQEVSAEDWIPGKEIKCRTTGRLFKLPSSYDLLPRMTAEVMDGPGVIVVPQTGERLEVAPDNWNAGAVIEVDSEDQIELLLPDSIPEIKSAAVISDQKFGEVRSPYSDDLIEIQEEKDWVPEKILRLSGGGYLYRLPDPLPEWTLTAKVDLERTGEKGYVFSPYITGGESIEIAGADWVEGSKILCGESKRHFILPELPPLEAALINGRKGIVACPYSNAKKRDQTIPPEEWVEGREIESSKFKGRVFKLPSRLPALEATAKKDRPGYLVSPYDSKAEEFQVDGEDWLPDHSLKCPLTGHEIITPSESEFPVPRTGILVQDEEVEDAFVTGMIESPYEAGRRQKVTVADWRAERQIRCEASGLLMKLPAKTDGFPVWADEAKLDPKSPGAILHPETGASIAIEGTLWERRSIVVLKGEPGVTVQLPRDIPPLVAVVAGGRKIRTPYEKGQKEYEVEIGDWEPGKIISCPATGRPLKLPGDLPLPEAMPDEKIAGLVFSPYDPESSFRVSLDKWKPREILEDPKGRKIQLPGALPALPEATDFDLSKVEVTPPFAGSKPIKPAVWKAGESLTCSATGGHFSLPGNLPLPEGTLTVDARKALPTSHGIIVDPFSGKEIEVEGKSWVSGSTVQSGDGNEFKLPDKLPLLSAVLDTDRPGFVKSPYASTKPFRIQSISDWVEGASVKCPKTQRTMMLPDGLPFSQDEVLQAWESGEKARKSLLLKLGVGGAVLLVVLAIVFLRPDPAARWAKWEAESENVAGIERLAFAAKAHEMFPGKREDLSKYAVSSFNNFDKFIDRNLTGMPADEVRKLEKQIRTFTYGDSKILADAAMKSLAEGERLLQISSSSAEGFTVEAVDEEVKRIEKEAKAKLPSLSGSAIAALGRQKDSLIGEKVVKVMESPDSASKGKGKGSVAATPDSEKPKGPDAPVAPVKEEKAEKEKGDTTVPLAANLKLKGLPELVWIKPGTFGMGTAQDELSAIYNELSVSSNVSSPRAPKDEALRQVTLSEGYWVAETEVTIENFLDFMNSVGIEKGDWIDEGAVTCPIEQRNGKWVMKEKENATWGSLNQPMTEVTWEGAMQYSKWLTESNREKIPDGYEFSLPTEAQWERAARAGSATPLPGDFISFKGYNHSDEVSKQAWYAGNSQKAFQTAVIATDWAEKEITFDFSGSQEVGGKKANDWGLYDVIGNVSEWCFDVYSRDTYKEGDVTDPVGPSSTSADVRRVVRGGNYFDQPFRCRVAVRRGERAIVGSHFIGFRVALVPQRR
ncbi:bifunctional serine/threonine-protein kinase/formylglycine-generating enzyme family protein [Verrucomicrobiales bacterium BCK34]|nr:bifunctional serine/threonine-protein kinase/formylglycine-generating enzyme family protein [Verrucomicrobiales bacterium BCK34]